MKMAMSLALLGEVLNSGWIKKRIYRMIPIDQALFQYVFTHVPSLLSSWQPCVTQDCFFYFKDENAGTQGQKVPAQCHQGSQWQWRPESQLLFPPQSPCSAWSKCASRRKN